MSRAFITLYIAVAVFIAIMGFALDKFWQSYQPLPSLTPLELQLISFLAEQSEDGIDRFQSEQVRTQRFDLESLAESSMAARIKEGEIVAVFNDAGEKLIYLKVLSDQVLEIRVMVRRQSHSDLHGLLLLIFYFLIAVVIFIWIWPLSRDLKRLRGQMRSSGEGGVPQTVSLPPNSFVLDLANAFNRMRDRIHDLINSHKEMTSAVSHELRTPLARMRFALDIALVEQDQSKVREHLEGLKLDVAEMESLVTGILQYAGFEQHSQKLVYQRGELLPLVETLTERNAEGASKAFSVRDETESMSILSEPKLMERALHNVIQNAFRYADSQVRITLQTNEADKQYVVVVEDDGQGISEADRTKILEPFVRLPGQNQKSGFGLGLAITRRVLQWHQGRVEISDSDLGGAKFILSWPIQLDELQDGKL